MMRITALKAKNIKALKELAFEPQGHLIIIGGPNAAGKTTALDCIEYALAGKDAICSEPLRRGEKKGETVLNLDGDEAKGIPPLIVTRSFRKDGATTLKVETPDGTRPAKPQTLLDSFYSQVGFDPHGFTRFKPDQQAKTLRALVGLDFSELDTKRKTLFDERTDLGRDARAIQARLDNLQYFPEAPEEEVSVAELVAKLEEAQATNRAKSTAKEAARQSEREVAETAQITKRAIQRVEELKRELAQREAEVEHFHERRLTAEKEAKRLKDEADAMPDIDCQPLHDQIAGAETVNVQVRTNRQHAQLAEEYADLREGVDELTKKLEALDADKQRQLEAAKWPIDGLGFDEDGITYQDLPFHQASSAEQLRVAVAIGLALNPTLRVLLIRDGSLLDDANLSVLAEMATQADAQVWLERVGEGEECAVVIENGELKTKGESDGD